MAVGLQFLLLLCIVVAAQFQIGVLGEVSQNMEDALAASNLASAVIDIEEYGISHKMIIRDFDQAYAVYCEALKGNLGLNEMWERESPLMSAGKVRVECYILFNVYDNLVHVRGLDENGNRYEYTGDVGRVTAPNGAVIEQTAIYSEISFPVRGLGGMEQMAHKGKLVDLCEN